MSNSIKIIFKSIKYSIDEEKLKHINVDFILKYFLYAYLVWSFVRYSLTDPEKNTYWIVPLLSSVSSLIEPFFIFLLFFSMLVIVCKKVKLELISAFFIVLLVLAYCMSIISSTENITNSIKFFAGYYKFIALFIISIYLTKKHIINTYEVLRIILVLIVLQFVINTLWFFDIQLLHNSRALISSNPDWAYGTMENTHMLATVYAIVFILGMFLMFKKKYKYKVLGFSILLVGVLQIVWAESKTNFFTISFALMIITFFNPEGGFSIKRIGLIIGILFSFVFVSSIIYSDLSHFAASSDGIWENIRHFWIIFNETLKYNYKFEFLNYLVFDFPDDIYQFLFGAGPGMLASNFALENPTALSKEYLIPLMEKNYNTGNSILMNPHTGYTAILGDLGWFGFISYFGFHFYLLLKLTLRYKKGYFKNHYQKLAAMIWIGLMINYLLNNIFKDILYIGAPVVIIWILGGILLSQSKNNQMKYKLVEVQCP